MTHHENGRDESPAIVEIVRLRRISQSQPTAWEGFTSVNIKAHVAYRYGVLSISLWRSSRQHGRNWGFWDEVVRFQPAEMMAVAQLCREFGDREHPATSAMAIRLDRLRLENQNRIMGEIRADVWPRKDRATRIVDVRELWAWLDMRDKFFEALGRAGLSGGAGPDRKSVV